MPLPLMPNNNPSTDLLFWLKQYLSRKSVTLTSGVANENHEKMMVIRSTIKSPSSTLDEVDDAVKSASTLGFKALRNYAYPAIDFIRFCERIKIGSIKDITAMLVQEDYFGSKAYESNATKKNHYRAIVGFINYIEKNNEVDESGAGYLFGMEKMPRSFDEHKIPDTLMPDEFKRFTSFLDNGYASKSLNETQRNRLMLKLLCYVGLRTSELLGLRVNSFTEIDGDDYYGLKIKGKGNKERIAYIKAELIKDDLEAHKKGMKEIQKLFDLTPSMVYIIVKHALKMSMITKGKMGGHLLRHSYATYLLSVGTSLSVIQKLLGHSSISTTVIYASVIDSDIKNAAGAFE